MVGRNESDWYIFLVCFESKFFLPWARAQLRGSHDQSEMVT